MTKVNFRRLSEQDILLYQKRIDEDNIEISDYCVGTSVAWNAVCCFEIAEVHNCLIVRSDYYNGESTLYFPIGKRTKDKVEAIKMIIEHYNEIGMKLKFRPISVDHIKILNKFFPEKFSFIPNRDEFDYYYDVDTISESKGRRMSSIRHLIKKFCDLGEYRFEHLNSNNINKCLEFEREWLKNRAPEVSHEIYMQLCNEEQTIKMILDNYKNLKLDGILLFQNEKMVGFDIVEEINSDMIHIKYGKALRNVTGSFQMLNRIMAKEAESKYLYINLESDLGIPGLRESKMSYLPYHFVEKYEAELINIIGDNKIL